MEFRYPEMLSAHTSDFVGERAGWQLEDMLGCDRDSLSAEEKKLALRALAALLEQSLRDEARRILGAHDADVLFAMFFQVQGRFFLREC